MLIRDFLIGVLVGFAFNKLIRVLKLKWLIHKSTKELERIEKLGPLKAGWAMNPALKYPPHYPCFCGSGAKFRQCCLKTLPRYVKEKSLPQINKELENCQRFVKANLGKLKKSEL